MRRGSFSKKYLLFIFIAGIFQLFAIISDQVVLQLDAYIKKYESNLILTEMQSENTLNLNLIISQVQRNVIDILYYIDEYNEVIDKNEKFNILSILYSFSQSIKWGYKSENL